MRGVHQGRELCDELGKLPREVQGLGLGGVGGEVVERELWGALLEPGADQLPVSPAHRLGARRPVLPVEVRPGRGVQVPPGGGGEGHAVRRHVGVGGRGRADQVQHGGRDVDGGDHLIGDDPLGEVPRPAGEERDADPALVELPLVAPARVVALEERRVHAPHVGGAVVAREQHDGVLRHAAGLEGVEDPADLVVEEADHPGVRAARAGVGQVGLLTEVRLGVPLRGVALHVLLGHLEGEVGDDRRVVEEEGLVTLRGRVEPVDHVVRDELRRVALAALAEPLVVLLVALQGSLKPLVGLEVLRPVDGAALPVQPEVGGVVVVGHPLAEVAIEVVEALAFGRAAGARAAQAPLAVARGPVPEVAQALGEGDLPVGERPLSLGLVRAPPAVLPVRAHLGVAGVLAREEDAARRGADRRAGVPVGEPDTALGDGVDARRLDVLLAVAAELAGAQVIHEDDHDVGAGRVAWPAVGQGRGGAGGEERGEREQ